MGELKLAEKSFDISKTEVWEAYRQVKANQGAPGVDGVTLAAFEADLKNNLYRIWNRMSSGSYFPPPVKAVQIAKAHGAGIRTLGVPTVADRVAQTVVATRLQAKVEPIFHADSYGYRPGRSALGAVAVCQQRCFKHDWVIDIDVQAFFDSVDWDLMLTAVAAHCTEPWVLLYVRRWLAAPLAGPDGGVRKRVRGTPQGSAVSPVLANLFLHYAFDAWMSRTHPGVVFERYADDIVVHCATKEQAMSLLVAIQDRMVQVGLLVNPAKTRIVYCKDGRRGLEAEHVEFTFLGFTFRARAARSRTGQVFTGFLSAVSTPALTRMRQQVRRWRLHLRTGLTLAELARMINPVVRGWMQYYGAFYRSALDPLLKRINSWVMRYLRRKFKRLRPFRTALACWSRVTRQQPTLFAHWAWSTALW